MTNEYSVTYKSEQTSMQSLAECVLCVILYTVSTVGNSCELITVVMI